jgi:hypothetical protein
VEETLKAMLDAEAGRCCRAERHLQTAAGEVTLKVPSCAPRRLSRRSSNAVDGEQTQWKKRYWRGALRE